MMDDDASERYADIILLPHHRSTRRAPMPRADRAAQFASFAALSGHAAAIRETARTTEVQRELSDSAKAEINTTLCRLQAGDMVAITWFEPDACKAGGAYLTIADSVRKIEPERRLLLLGGGHVIPLDAIAALELI